MIDKDILNRVFKDVKQYKTEKLIDILTDLAEFIETTEKEKEKVKKQLSEWDKDEEILKLKKENKKLNNELSGGLGFFITATEKHQINEWIEKHINEKHNGDYYAGAIGGRFSYRFVPTSIGEIGEIVCSCGDSFCFREIN